MFKKEALYTNADLEQRLDKYRKAMEHSCNRLLDEKMRTITFLVAENQALRMELESLREKTEESSDQRTDGCENGENLDDFEKLLFCPESQNGAPYAR